MLTERDVYRIIREVLSLPPSKQDELFVDKLELDGGGESEPISQTEMSRIEIDPPCRQCGATTTLRYDSGAGIWVCHHEDACRQRKQVQQEVGSAAVYCACGMAFHDENGLALHLERVLTAHQPILDGNI